MKKDNLPQEIVKKLESNENLKGISRAIFEHKKEILKLHKMPMTSDCAMETISAERSFRKAITSDIQNLVKVNCDNCPFDECKTKSCPFYILDEMLKSRLNSLNQILPGGI